MSSEEYSETSEQDAGEFDFYGSMKASMCWDSQSKQLSAKLRQYVESERKLEFKYKGHLNTSTGVFDYRGALRKNIYSHSPPSMTRVVTAATDARKGARPSDPDINPDKFLPAGFRTLVLQDWVLSPGIVYDSSREQHLHYAMQLRKAPQVLRHSPKWDLWMTGKANVEVNPKTAKALGSANLKLKLLKYSVTSKQDLKLVAGLELSNEGQGGVWRQTPYLKVSENNLAVKLQRNRWTFMYEL